MSRPQLLRDCRALLNYDAPHFGDGTAEATDDQWTSDAKLMREIDAMPADEYKKRLMRDKAFVARIESAHSRKRLESRRGRK